MTTESVIFFVCGWKEQGFEVYEAENGKKGSGGAAG